MNLKWMESRLASHDRPNLDYATGTRRWEVYTDILKTEIALSSPIAHCFL